MAFRLVLMSISRVIMIEYIFMSLGAICFLYSMNYVLIIYLFFTYSIGLFMIFFLFFFLSYR